RLLAGWYARVASLDESRQSALLELLRPNPLHRRSRALERILILFRRPPDPQSLGGVEVRVKHDGPRVGIGTHATVRVLRAFRVLDQPGCDGQHIRAGELLGEQEGLDELGQMR